MHSLATAVGAIGTLLTGDVAGPVPSTTIQAIDQFCAGLAPMTRHLNRGRLFGLLDDRGDWVEFKRDADMDVEVEANRVHDMARVWSRSHGGVVVWMRPSTPSGAWSHFIQYCFRSDGTLAQVHSTLNTSHVADKDPDKEGIGASRVRIRYFDASGKQLKVSRRIRDLNTGRPAPTLQITDDESEPIYKTVQELPFHRLLNGESVRTTVIDVRRPAVIVFAPSQWELDSESQAGVLEMVAHVRFAVDDMNRCKGATQIAVQMVFADRLALTFDGRRKVIDLSRKFPDSAGAYLFRPGRKPCSIATPGDTAFLGDILSEAVGEVFDVPMCLQKGMSKVCGANAGKH